MRLRRSAASRATAALALAAVALPALGAAPLALRAEPPALVLGAGEGATITIDGGAAAELPRVTANVGRIVNLRALGDGRFAAEYLPPPTSHPQVAIVAAHSAERWGWTAIPLWGRGLATARSAPHAEIRVTIGDASFGPVRADAAGEAHVPVVVPAGVERAYHRDKPLDLRIPPSLHVLVALERDAAPADVDQDVPLRVFTVTPAGAPREAAPVVVEVTHGELVGLAEVAPGELAATWRLPRGKAGPASAEARLADEPALASVVTLARAAGAPARVALESDRARAVAGEAPVALRVRVMDAAGNPADGEPRIAATLGDVSALVAIAPGTWEARLAVPAAVRWWARRSEVSARAGGVEGRIAIDIAPAPVPPGARTRRVSAAPKLGVAASRGGLAAAYLGAEGAYRPSLLGGRLSLALEVGGFVRDRTDEVTVGEQLLTIHGRARYLPVIAGARFQHALGKRHAAWAGAGAGLAHVASEVSVGSGPVTSESGVVPVLHASAGWGLRAGRATPFAEARLAWHAAPDFVAMRGSLATLTLLVGCRYDAL